MGLERFFRRVGRQPAEGEPPPEVDDAKRTPEGEGRPREAAGGPTDLSYSLGRIRPDEQRAAALERLTELRAAGKVSEENYLKEKRRLERWG